VLLKVAPDELARAPQKAFDDDQRGSFVTRHGLPEIKQGVEERVEKGMDNIPEEETLDRFEE
jgi:hypothetical protein